MNGCSLRPKLSFLYENFPKKIIGRKYIMALFLLNPGITPLGDFDVLDTDQSSILGGEVMTLDEAARANSSTVKAAADVLDGYVADGASAATRVIARIADETSETYKAFYLSDDGTTHYGVMFGSVIGGPVGLATTGTNLGPHTSTGSGKVTLWDKPGLYAVSTDAVEDALSDLTDTPLPGAYLYRYTTGKLTSLADTGDKVALYVEHASNGSLVTTPGRLVGASESFDRIKIQFLGTGAAAAVA